MGNICCEAEETEKSYEYIPDRHYSLHAGIFAMQQNSFLAGLSGLQATVDFQKKIRQAKQEMRTVSVQDGSLYIDYQFAGLIPPGVNIEI